MIRRTSGANRFNIYKFSQVLGLRSMEKVISRRDDFIVTALFYFEPVQRFEYGMICSVLGSSCCTSNGVLQKPETRYLFNDKLCLGKVSYNSLI